MRPRTIVVEDHNPAWAQTFEALRGAIWPLVSAHARQIEHVGSTSVAGLAAKPIIDIDVIVAGEAELTRCADALGAGGWHHRGELGIPGRHAFTRHPAFFPHNLYVCIAGSDALNNHLLLRDHLRQHPKDVAAYAQLKRDLARNHPHDIGAYVEGKTTFILGILAKNGMPVRALSQIEQANQKRD